MKNYIIITVAVLLIFSCDKENKNYKDTEIYVKVINNIKDCQDIKDCIQFSDNRGGAVSIPGSQKFYTSIVNPGKKVTWMGKDSIYKIDIIDVSFKPLDGSTDILKSKPQKESGTVVGKVKDKGGNENLSNEFYKITFSINNDTITIDPVIQLHND
jgi:hypothetical protein